MYGVKATPVLPNFFIVGAPKAGTTSLYRYLKQHPQIYMSPVKEPSYFASEIQIENLCEAFKRHVRRQSPHLREYVDDGKPPDPYAWLVLNSEDYETLFHRVKDEKAIGEATVSYLWSETAAGNIHRRIPDAKIVMILRDPAERAFSHYMHQLSEGLTRATFREHIQRAEHGDKRQINAVYPFLELGLYYQQVKRYLDLFPRKNVRIYWYEEAWQQPGQMLAELFGFLDVDPTFDPDTSRRAFERRAPRLTTMVYLLKKYDLWEPGRRLIPRVLRPRIRSFAFRRRASLVMDPNDRQYLIGYYRDDVQKLAAMLDRDLSGWLG